MQQTWKNIEYHYLEAVDYMSEYTDMHRAMAELCNWIGTSNMSTSLFGRTSHHTLSISQVKFEDMSHLSTQFLRINPDFDTKKIEFRFIDTHLEKKQWSRTEPPESTELIKRLVGFVKQVGWTYELE